MLGLKKKNYSLKKRNNVFIYSSGCERRNIDLVKICSYLSKNDYNITSDPKEADYTILMTCGFVKSATDESLEVIKKFKKYKSEIIVAGCLPDIIKDKFDKESEEKIIPTRDITRIEKIFSGDNVTFRNLEDEHSIWQNFNKRTCIGVFKIANRKIKLLRSINMFFVDNILKKILGKNFYKIFPFNRVIAEQGNYYILISRGCIHNCTYCSIRKAVGLLKSKPLDQCIKEFKIGLNGGYKKFVLEADDLGPYGSDIKSNLSKLLDSITNIDGNYSLTLKNTHPIWIIKYASELEGVLKRKKIKSILFSIQSGNNRILKLMGRPYSKEVLINTILKLKNIDPNLEIGVQIMIGFPTEKREEFLETLKLFEKIPIDFGEIFPFSCQEGTKADCIEPKIPGNEIRKRTKYFLKFLRKKNYFAWYYKQGTCISFYTK